jgi:DNA-binding CsgD family transcriptional regulator
VRWSYLLQAVCEGLQRTLRVSSAVLVPANPQTGQFQFEHNFLFNNEATVFVQYISHYASLDPLATNRWIWQYDNSAARYSDFVSPAQLADSEFGRDFLPQIPIFHCLCTTLGCQGDPVGALGLHRRKIDRGFTDRDKEIVRLLAPHLSKALHNLSLLDAMAECLQIGMIVLGAEERTLYMNEEARLALNGKPVTEIPDPGLCAEGALFKTETRTYQVRTLPMTSVVRQSVGGDMVSMENLHSVQGRRTAKVILLEPLPARWSLKSKLSRFDLSPRQEEIAALVLQGFSNREIAERLFICEQTVKDHLHDIFDRMKLRKRSQLAAKLFELIPS